MNSMFGGRKKFSVSDKNELIVHTKDNRGIGLDELSSGEKQLLIILGEALLQHSKSVIYIADEPELSLHVIWQEQLTGAITKLNPNAQIIFATHSPDIVGVNQDAIIDMEKIVL
ncbi:AAA family ATPase [Aeromonas salmonicida]|uniref:AAA family ATPase n=1 Tax=Aeromonas salmonicida TaxID=645 RepID=UPI003D1E82D3